MAVTAPIRPPLRPTGVVDGHQYGTLVVDVYEHIPDLTYPLSVDVYAQMRRDGRLASVLSGYTLQLRRAQWQLNGSGCRPEVVQLVADCLGLNVQGESSPSGFRRHGVSWNEHLRAALSHLTFGHAGFELVAEIADGKARLATLAERLPHSIAAIHSDPKTGAFLGVDQTTVRGPQRGPQITADRMAWYAHEREGSAWQGVSLLRPAYGPWLIKREMIRVAAISNRRWGAGVPVAEALPGTNPTPAQMREAQEMMSAARAGDQAGAAVPPGFVGKILGLSGSVPDTLAFIEWLNREMSSAALMQHLDLGQGGNGGSRALGQAFVDSWTLALESIGENIADTATRQIAARIVDWNWGPDEPVPVVSVSGVGSRREVTAESLQLLLNSGALSADPALEAWVRREYRLPERDEQTPWTQPTRNRRGGAVMPSQDPPADAEGESGRVAAAAPETVNVEQYQADHEQATTEAANEWETAATALVAAVAAATAAEVAGGMLVGLGALSVPASVTAPLVALLSGRMVTLAGRSAQAAAAEASPFGSVSADLPDDVRDRIGQVAQATVDMIVSGYATGAAREALLHAGTDLDVDAIRAAVEQHLTDLSRAKGSGLVYGNVAAAMTSAQAVGREAVFAQLPAGTKFAASEVADRNRCGPCGEVDGTVYESLADALADYPTGIRYKRCAGSLRCRGLIYPVPSR